MQTKQSLVGATILTAIVFGLAALVASPAFAQTDDYGTGTTSGTYCPQLFQTVVRGSSGNQVLELQKFLSDYYDIPPTTIQTGYFGRITQGYVIQFQKEQGLPSYGIAGSMTRAKIAEVCKAEVSGTKPQNPSLLSAKKFPSISPLFVEFSYPTNAPGADKSITIDFGDGSIGNMTESGGCTDSIPPHCWSGPFQASHYYAKAGTYTATIRNECSKKVEPCNFMPVMMGLVTVKVGDESVSAGKYWLLAHPGPDRIVVGQEGTWTVQLAPYQNNNDGVPYTIDWGDGTPASNAAVPALLTHTYQKPGRYPLSVALGGAYPTKPETYSYVTVVASSDAGTCDTQYAAAMQASKKEGCQIGGWMMMCKADQNNPNYQNIAYNSCMMKELEQKGWIMPKAL